MHHPLPQNHRILCTISLSSLLHKISTCVFIRVHLWPIPPLFFPPSLPPLPPQNPQHLDNLPRKPHLFPKPPLHPLPLRALRVLRGKSLPRHCRNPLAIFDNPRNLPAKTPSFPRHTRKDGQKPHVLPKTPEKPRKNPLPPPFPSWCLRVLVVTPPPPPPSPSAPNPPRSPPSSSP